MTTGAVAFWNILIKDMRTYYLNPPNISWGIAFPLAWTAMFFIKSGEGLHDMRQVLPGVVAVSILFGTTSMLAVAVTFEKITRSFERLLLAPISLTQLMLAKRSGAIVFGMDNASVPMILAALWSDLGPVQWPLVCAAIFLIAAASTFLRFFIAVAVSEVFEAQTSSNFFSLSHDLSLRPVFPIDRLPTPLRPVSYGLPLTYGAGLLLRAIEGRGALPVALDLSMITLFCVALFLASLWNIQRKWIL